MPGRVPFRVENGAGLWILLVAILLALFAVRCNRDGSSVPEGGPILNAEEAYRKRTCYRCHGDAREGTEIGPPLVSLAENWDVDRLMRYIADPAPFRKHDPRMEQLVDDYKGRLMKGYKLAESERRALSIWLLQAVPASAGSR